MIEKAALIINLVAALGVAGLFIFTEVIYNKQLPDDSIEYVKLVEQSKKDAIFSVYKMEKITLNLYSQTSRLRFLDIEMNIHPFRATNIEKLKEMKYVIYDAAITIAGRMEFQDLNTITGKILLEERIKNEIHKYTTKPMIKDIFFSKFVTQ